ncbi:beta-ketoacyl-acyl-carrier-protein synthase ii [Nannochloropsis gaditana]|uniref:Beta-ketoacyl-acyl-carrier-protein synthase ii n=1 Tax=Nannochloropsis gaditana TaxID=72520 RepID=W7TJP8_9STRA|nr:beta-ketoacyl-acyl-carrier-protein synthase ii [Nannochloropsis gaditana]
MCCVLHFLDSLCFSFLPCFPQITVQAAMEKLSLAVVGSLAVASAFQPSSFFLLQHPSLSSRSSPVARKAGSISMDLPPLQRKRVVITGVGAVSPLGWGDDFWNGLIEGRSGISPTPSSPPTT